MKQTNPTAGLAPDGRLWFATLSGVAILDPQALDAVGLTQAPQIVSLSINKKQYAVANVNTPIEAAVGQGQLEIRFTLPQLTQARRIQLSYRLEGFDQGWIAAKENRVAVYTGLPAGNYVFSVSAHHPHGETVRTQNHMAIHLVPPFHRRKGVWLAGLGVVAGMLFGLHRLRLWQQRVSHASVLAERNRIARELHDNLEQSLVGIKLHLEAAQNAKTQESWPPLS